jgi:hypothetical protein
MKLKLAGDRAKAFPQVDNPSGYTELEVWNCGYDTLSPISRFTELRTLLVGKLPDAELSFLAGLAKLEQLNLQHFPRLSSIDVLGSLPRLRSLTLSTATSWIQSRKRLVIDSFAPLARSRSLEILTLSDVVPADGDLVVLAGCASLRSLDEGNRFPIEQLVALKAARPNLAGPSMTPVSTSSPHTTCNRCGQENVMLAGARRPIVCPSCSADRIRDNVAEWNALLARARRQP